MRLARWMDADGAVWVGEESGGSLAPLARVSGHPDAQILSSAVSGSHDEVGRPTVSISAVRLLPPIMAPGAVRDFSAFLEHAATARQALVGEALPDSWYTTPVCYFTNPHGLRGTGDLIVAPATEELDFELEVGVVIARDARDVPVDDAEDYVAGYTIFNDWSARDIQRHEKSLGSGGPTKSKDFCSSIGPYLVTPGSVPWTAGEPAGTMRAYVNGVLYSEGDMSGMHFSFSELIAHATRDSLVRAGDILASGTVGTGCILELSAVHGPDRYPWLVPGDVVSLEVDGLGTLTNTVGTKQQPRPSDA